METYQVKPIFNHIKKDSELTVTVSGSKSITNRALLLATLAEGESRLKGVLFSDDSRHFLECVKELGFEVEIDEELSSVCVRGCGGVIPKREASIYVGSAGTAARFLTALLGVSEGIYHLNSSSQMKKRPMAPLLETLQRIGTEIVYEEQEGYFPFVLNGHACESIKTSVNIDKSSQFLSALLIAAGALKEESCIAIEGTHGMAYIEMTRHMMEQFGVTVRQEESEFVIPKGQAYQAQTYHIEPDVSAACYFYAMAALLGVRVMVKDVHFDGMQGDLQFIRFLEQMGCQVEDRPEGISVKGQENGHFSGIDADMHACSDQAITMAALAPFADTETTIHGVGHIRLQESNRIAGIISELRVMGIRCEELSDGVKIYPGKPKPSRVKTYDDHRMAMGFALIGLRAEGIEIENPLCCKKTFETYFDVLNQIIGEFQ